jgi:hypothetical protein
MKPGLKGLADREKRGMQHGRAGGDGKSLARLGLAAGAQRQLQLQVYEFFARGHVAHGRGVPALGFGDLREFAQVGRRLQLQPAGAALAVQGQHAERRAYHHVLYPALAQRQVFEFLRDGRLAQQGVLLARQRGAPGLLVPPVGLAQQGLDGVGQAQADLGGLLGNELLDQPAVEGRDGKLLVGAPCQQHARARPARQLAEHAQPAHRRHGIVHHADLREPKTRRAVLAPVLQDLRDQRRAFAPAVDDLLLAPGVGFPSRRLPQQQLDAGHRAEEEAHVPVQGHDLGQHFEIVRVVIQKDHASWPAVKGKGHGCRFRE